MNFSVLMSIYNKENPNFFNRAMTSIWDEQTIKPSEIILVEDGKLTDELYKIISIWKEKLNDNLIIVPLKKNFGLGIALNIGINHCNYELIARMDTDDIAFSNRFEKQLKVFKENQNISICSSWISEFEDNEKNIISHRKLPELHDDIVNFAKMRNPINHPAVMYKKSVILSIGGYKDMLWFEDYYLWVRLLLNDVKFYNIQEALVNMRTGYEQIKRRSGLNYIKAEFNFLRKINNIGFLNNIEFLKSIFLRTIVRILPKKLIKLIYKFFR